MRSAAHEDLRDSRSVLLSQLFIIAGRAQGKFYQSRCARITVQCRYKSVEPESDSEDFEWRLEAGRNPRCDAIYARVGEQGAVPPPV